jgi:hypothetical protein
LPEELANGSVGTTCWPFTDTLSATTDGATRLTALMIRSWSLVPELSGAAITSGGLPFWLATPAKWVLAKSIIEKLPMIAPTSPIISAGRMRMRIQCSSKFGAVGSFSGLLVRIRLLGAGPEVSAPSFIIPAG